MRLLCVTDVHYHLPQLDWLLDQAGAVDVVVLPGDHLQVDGRTPLEAQVVVVTKYLRRLAQVTTVLAASGNHDLDGPGPEGEQHAGWLPSASGGRLFVDGQSVDLDGVRFTVCPWWDGPATRAAVEAQLEHAAADRPDRWVWVYHSPPAGTRLCRTGTREYPDRDLAGWIDRWQPDLVVCGHIHQAPWVDGGGWIDRVGRTWVVNAGHQTGREPSHVIVDLDAQTAQWFGVPDVDETDLAPGWAG
jgi:Icc-related predicted phosphoesterase